MTRATDPVTAFVVDVEQALLLTGPARRMALRDLRATVREAVDVEGPDGVGVLGPPAEVAARLAADYGDERFTVLGMPVSLDPREIPARLRAVMDPAGPLFVPRVFGVGWGVNVGRLLRQTGFIHADDLDDDVARAVPARVWRAAAAGVAAPLLAAGLVAADGVRSMDAAPLHWPWSGGADRWGSPRVAFGRALALGLVGASLAGAAVRGQSLPTRAGALATGCVLVDLAVVITAMTRWGGRRTGAWALVGFAVGLARAAVTAGAVVRSGRSRVVTRPAPDEPPTDEPPVAGAPAPGSDS